MMKMSSVGCLVLFSLWACNRSAASGAEGSQAPYQVAASVEGTGSKRELRLSVKAINAYKINQEYPIRFLPEKAQTEVLFGQSEYKLEATQTSSCEKKPEDVCGVELKVPFEVTEQASGLGGVLKMSVCSQDKCLIEKVKVSAKIPQSQSHN